MKTPPQNTPPTLDYSNAAGGVVEAPTTGTPRKYVPFRQPFLVFLDRYRAWIIVALTAILFGESARRMIMYLPANTHDSVLSYLLFFQARKILWPAGVVAPLMLLGAKYASQTGRFELPNGLWVRMLAYYIVANLIAEIAHAILSQILDSIIPSTFPRLYLLYASWTRNTPLWAAQWFQGALLVVALFFIAWCALRLTRPEAFRTIACWVPVLLLQQSLSAGLDHWVPYII